MQYQRGQALIETAAFLPLVLLCMVAIIYFSQFGVLQGRAVQAVRYATLVTNGGGVVAGANSDANLFTLQSVYAELDREGTSAANGTSDPGYPVANYACSGSGTVQADAAAKSALSQQETMPGGVAAATAAPTFFQADLDLSPSAACVVNQLYLPGGSVNLAASYFTTQFTSINAGKDTPGFLKKLGFSKPQMVSAGMAYTLPAGSGPMMYCSQGFGSLVATSLAGLLRSSPYPAPTSYGGYPTPGAVPRPGC
jgi:hypothetical protein